MTTRHLLLLALTLGLAPGPSPAQSSAPTSAATAPAGPTAQEIVAASVAAAGGDALDAVRSVRRRADMHLEGEMFGILEGPWEIAFEPGRRGFQRVDFEYGSTAIGWDGTHAWEETAMGLRDLNAGEIALNRWLWELSYLHRLARDGDAASLVRLEDEAIDGRPQYVLESVDLDGGRTRIYVDAETKLVSRLASSIEIPGLCDCAASTDYADYREIAGIMLPRVSSQTIERLWTYRATFTETEIDPELPDSLFVRPSGS